VSSPASDCLENASCRSTVFPLKTEVTTDEEFEEVYSNAMIELMLEDFAGIWFYLTVWGLKKHET
jgi:hypothetical protein